MCRLWCHTCRSTWTPPQPRRWPRTSWTSHTWSPRNKAKEAIEEEEGEDLCDCTFSLAYGAKILLNNTRLRLKKGRRYGLCGPNGAGKVRFTSPMLLLTKGVPAECGPCPIL